VDDARRRDELVGRVTFHGKAARHLRDVERVFPLTRTLPFRLPIRFPDGVHTAAFFFTSRSYGRSGPMARRAKGNLAIPSPQNPTSSVIVTLREASG
jgi:hypothetical protein